MEQQFWVTIVQASSAIVVAFFTGMLFWAQKANNRALKQQTKILEAQQHLQKQLAESEVRPLVTIQAKLLTDSQNARFNENSYQVMLTNLGRYGVVIVKLKQHEVKPQELDSESFVGTPAGFGKQRFPIPLPSGQGETLHGSDFNPEDGRFVEVIYEDGSSGRRLSDLWRYTGQDLGFIREWWARETLRETQQPY